MIELRLSVFAFVLVIRRRSNASSQSGSTVSRAPVLIVLMKVIPGRNLLAIPSASNPVNRSTNGLLVVFSANRTPLSDYGSTALPFCAMS